VLHTEHISYHLRLVPVFARRVAGIDFLQGNDVHIEVCDNGGDLVRIHNSISTDTTVDVVSHDPQ
jgi:hypothetical protein